MNEALALQHAQDWRVVISFLLFLLSFWAGTFLIYDVIRCPNKQKLIFSHWKGVIILTGLMFYTLSIFGLARFFDALHDLQFLIAHPELQTTLSQQSLILELPLLGVCVSILLVSIAYLVAYVTLKRGDEIFKR